MTRLRLFFRRQRIAWHGLLRRRVTLDALTLHPPTFPAHPSTLCRCFPDVALDQQAAAHADHMSDCPWLAAMCRLCRGSGACNRCGGDGTDPRSSAPDLLADRALLRGAIEGLEYWALTDEARALRTLLERLDGAP